MLARSARRAASSRASRGVGLLDYLGRSVAGGADAVRRHLITEHRLQPWSPHYFRGPSLSGETGALFSYAADYAEVARRVGIDSRSAARPLFMRPLPEPGPEWRQAEIHRLIDFFSHPVRFLLRERLGIHLGAGEAELPAEEPFRLGRQDGSRLAERLLPLCLAGADDDTGIAEIALAGSELPHGAPGRIELQNEWRELARFRADLIRLGPTHPLVKPGLDALPLALTIGEVSLTGSLSGLHADGLFGHRLGTRGAFTLWNAWLRHLCLCAVGPTGIAARSRWLLKDVLLEFTPVEDAEAELGTLLRQYRRGLSRPSPTRRAAPSRSSRAAPPRPARHGPAARPSTPARTMTPGSASSSAAPATTCPRGSRARPTRCWIPSSPICGKRRPEGPQRTHSIEQPVALGVPLTLPPCDV